jgi:ACS family glucarate transporter-like MFS transporter
MANVELATFAGMPLLLSVVADVTGGLTTDSLSRRFGRRVGRCGVGAVAYLLAAIAMVVGTLVGNGRIAGFLIALGAPRLCLHLLRGLRRSSSEGEIRPS